MGFYRTILASLMIVPLLAAPAFAQQRLSTVPASRPVAYVPYQNSATLNRAAKAPWNSLSANEKAMRMNRDYDYPMQATSAGTIIVPPKRRDVIAWRRAVARAEAQADANFKAMSADERRAFLTANRAAFNAGYNPRPVNYPTAYYGR